MRRRLKAHRGRTGQDSIDAPLICLEPWTGTATQESEDDVFEHKQGMRMLAPGEKAEYAFTVTVY